MKYTWDIKILDPILFLILCLVFLLYLNKLQKIKKDGLFFAHQFCFWTSIYTTIKLNNQFTLAHFLNNNESLWLIIFFSITFYSIFLFIPANIITTKFRNRKIWLYLAHILSIPSVILFMCWPTIYSSIILAMFSAFAAASTSTSYFFYSENYQNRIFPFSTMSLIFTVLIFAQLFSSNIISVMSYINIKEYKDYNDNFYYISTLLIVFVFFIISLFLLFLIKEDKSFFGYCNIQFEQFQPFIWIKGIIIYIFLFFIILFEEIGHGLLFTWMLEQNTWTHYEDAKIVSLFSRLSSEIYYVSQIIFSSLVSVFLIKRIGIKYTFGLGLLLEFIYFSLMSFNSNPILFLLLDFISGVGFIFILLTLLSLTLMWQTRTPKKRIFPIFSTILAFTNFSSNYIIQNLSESDIGIFKLKNGTQNYIPDNNITTLLNSDTTIIFTILAVLILGLLIVFYYFSEFILAEYNNYIYFVNKMDEIKLNKMKHRK